MAILGLIVASAAVAVLFLPLRRIPDAVDQLGAWGPAAAVAAAAALLAALVPRTAISLACGALFGPLGGGATAWVGAMVAAATTVAVGRALGHDTLARYAGPRLARLDGWLARRGLLGVVVVRMMPLAPYGLMGYAYGTTSVRLGAYLFGTAIAAAPSAVSYAAIGAAAVRPGSIRLISFLPALIGFAITGAAAIYWRRLSVAEKASGGTDPDPGAS
jgi:uncharacterized membrane protein YdjX (TVP38/TMEM64 family)